MAFVVKYIDGQFKGDGDRFNDWKTASKRTLRAEFKESPFSLLPILSMLDDTTDVSLNSLHRRHVVSWHNLKAEVLKLANISLAHWKDRTEIELGKFLASIKCANAEDAVKAIRPYTLSPRLGKRERSNSVKGGTDHLDKLSTAMKNIYNSVGNVFVGFGRENSSIGTEDDTGADMIAAFNKWKSKTERVRIGGVEHRFKVRLDTETTAAYIEKFNKKTNDIVKAYKDLQEVTGTASTSSDL